MAKPVALYTTVGCPYSEDASDDLGGQGAGFLEHDVEKGRVAYARTLELTDGNRTGS